LIPLMKGDRSRSGSAVPRCRAVGPAACEHDVDLPTARCAPRQKWGPAAPNPTWGWGLRRRRAEGVLEHVLVRLASCRRGATCPGAQLLPRKDGVLGDGTAHPDDRVPHRTISSTPWWRWWRIRLPQGRWSGCSVNAHNPWVMALRVVSCRREQKDEERCQLAWVSDSPSMLWRSTRWSGRRWDGRPGGAELVHQAGQLLARFEAASTGRTFGMNSGSPLDRITLELWKTVAYSEGGTPSCRR